MSTSNRGFASFNKEQLKEVARRGGIKAHASGHAHQWDIETAKVAGRRGGYESGKVRRRQAKEKQGAAVRSRHPGIPDPE
jgi:general stress protein YciG